jgi:replicative DNA helicase
MRNLSLYNNNTPSQGSPIAGKSLPFSAEAERAVLGAILLNDEQINTVIEIIQPKDFYHKAHTTIFQGMIDLVKEQKRIDLISLQDHLEKHRVLQEIGGITYLLSLQEDIPSLGMIAQHARIIKDKSILRELIQSATHIISSCYEQNNLAIDEVLDLAERQIFQIANKKTQQSFIQLNIWLKKTFEHLSDIKNHAKGLTGVATGYKALDEMTSGFQKGDFIVMAARPSMGKTAICLGLAAHAARQGMSVGFFSLEMSAEQLTLRLLSMQASIAHHHLRNASITSDEWLDLTYIAGDLARWNLYIDDTAMLSLMEIRTKARKLKAEKGLDLLIIDYLQLLRTHTKHENRHQEVSEISRSLKALAKELEVPIIAISQLSRAVDSRMDKRPMLSDLRESGAIEQDADLIMFLYRDVVYNPETENPAIAELIVGKQRNGPTGTVFLNFVKELTKFEESTYEQKN